MAISVPVGIGAAVFVSEFCGNKTRELLKVVIELLAPPGWRQLEKRRQLALHHQAIALPIAREALLAVNSDVRSRAVSRIERR
jgi:hypothetical protein